MDVTRQDRLDGDEVVAVAAGCGGGDVVVVDGGAEMTGDDDSCSELKDPKLSKSPAMPWPAEWRSSGETL